MINEMNTFLKQGILEQDYFPAIRERLVSMMLPEEKKIKAVSTATRAPAFAQVLR